MSNGYPGLQLDRFLSIYSSNYYILIHDSRGNIFSTMSFFVMCHWWLSWLCQQDTRCFSTLFKGCQHSDVTQKKSRKKILNFQTRLIYGSVSFSVRKAICLFILIHQNIYVFIIMSVFCLLTSNLCFHFMFYVSSPSLFFHTNTDLPPPTYTLPSKHTTLFQRPSDVHVQIKSHCNRIVLKL